MSASIASASRGGTGRAMTIGEASSASRVSAKLIRYYEEIGLVRAVARTEGGYRVYTDSDVQTLRFIKRARGLGFSIEQIQRLLALWQDRSRASADVRAVALEHVAELEAKIQELHDMAETLRHLADLCHNDERPECPILADLDRSMGPHELGAGAKAPALPERRPRSAPLLRPAR